MSIGVPTAVLVLYRYLPMDAVAGFFWSRWFLLYVVVGGVFPEVFANLHLAVRNVSGRYLVDAVVAAAEDVGASVYKLGTALEVLNGSISVSEALGRPFFCGVDDVYPGVTGCGPWWCLAVGDVVLVLEVVAGFLVVSAFGTILSITSCGSG